MGYLKEKYTRGYFLKEDASGKPTTYGVAGIEDFHKGSIRPADRDILDRIDFRNKTVLDIGCGRGEAVKYAHEKGAARVIGVDFSENAIAIASEFLRKHSVPAELRCRDALEFVKELVIQKNAGNAPSIEIVLMLDAVEHIPRAELTDLLKSLKGVLSPRGLLAVNTPHFGIDNDVIAEGIKDLARDGSEIHEETSGTHCNRFTRSSLKRYMSRQGFCAISHHLFAMDMSCPRPLWATNFAKKRAHAAGYPILLPQALRPEWYDGYVWRTHPAMRPVRWIYRKWNKTRVHR